VSSPSLQQQHSTSQINQFHHMQPAHGARRGHGRQTSNAASEMEPGQSPRISSWVFPRWPGRGAHGGHGPTKSSLRMTMDNQGHQHSLPLPQRSGVSSQLRSRNGVDSTTHSDAVTFQREMFLKGADKEARVRGSLVGTHRYHLCVHTHTKYSPKDDSCCCFFAVDSPS
jgi:hypothetical protein